MTAREVESMRGALAVTCARDADRAPVVDSSREAGDGASARDVARSTTATRGAALPHFGAFGTNPAVVTDDDLSEDVLRRTMVRTAASRVPSSDTTNETGRAPRTTRSPSAPADAPPGVRHRTSAPLPTFVATARRIAATRGRTPTAHPIGAR